MKYIIALDAGTTSNRCIIFDKNGNAITTCQKEFTQYYPKPGWVEQDGNEIFSSMLGVTVEALFQSNINIEDVVSIGIANQRETTLIWDKETGTPIYNAIVWQCRRTANYADELKKDYAELFRNKTGLMIDAYFSATKLKWLLDNVPGAREKANNNELCFGTVDTWLMYRLSKGKIFATDYSNASRTMLFNIKELKWDQEILDILDIPLSILPEVKDSASLFGYTDASFFSKEIAICGVAGDQQAALFGQMCFKKGEAKNTYGTGGFLLLNTGSDLVLSKNGLITTIGWYIDGKVTYALEGSIFVAGAAIQWLRDELHLIDSASDSEYMASKVNDTNGCYVVPAFTGLGAPYWDQYARGTIVGITRGVNKYHIIRATLESIAYEVKDVFEAMENDAHITLSKLKVDGGASANNLLLQMQSDLLGVNVCRQKMKETTALGAMYLAGIGSSLFTIEDLLKMKKEVDEFEPKIDEELRAKKIKNWKRAVEYAKGWAYEE